MMNAVTTTLSAPNTDVIETALLAIPGVRSARILLGDDAGIAEVHAITTPRRSPKKIVRDIETFLMARYGYRIDYRRISLVQLADQPTVDRVNLVRVEQIQRPTDEYVEVELANGEQHYLAQALVADDLALAAAQATVNALNALFAPRAPLTLAGLHSAQFGPRQVITSYITYQDNAQEHMLGTTFVRQSVAEAVARAVLAATNRRIAGWFNSAAEDTTVTQLVNS